MERIGPTWIKWGKGLVLGVAIGVVIWIFGRDTEGLKRDIAVGPMAEDLRYDTYAGARPDAIADIAEIVSILETHPWVCIDPAADDSCGRFEHLAPASPGKLTATMQAIMTWEGMEAVVEGTVALQITDAGFCAPAEASFENVTVAGPDAVADRIAEQMDFLADVYDEAGDQLCASFAPPRYDASSDTFASTQYDALDSAFATEPLQVRFFAVQPRLRPREL